MLKRFKWSCWRKEEMNLSQISPHGNEFFWNILFNLQHSSLEILEPFLKMFSYSTDFFSADWQACGCVQYPGLLQFIITILVYLYQILLLQNVSTVICILFPSLDIDWHCPQFSSFSNTKTHILYWDFFFNPKSTNLAIKRQLRTARNSYTPFKFHAAVFSHTDVQVSISRRFMLPFPMFLIGKRYNPESIVFLGSISILKSRNTLTFI